ncbi:MAG TPA: DUF58 domain-containing protein [Gemmatimonadaceae bacterium]|nr:DUF58 domain-containing protein [Gemmatimonadaceae bacterium]
MNLRWRRSAPAARPPAPTATAFLGAPAPLEILEQVRRLELKMRRLVNSRFAGEYRSVYKGQGMEFSEVREYQPGDEVRSIDWNVTARLQKPYVKRYVEERELTVLLLVDCSASSHFGTRTRFKDDVALEVAAVLGLSALRNNDRVGLVAFTDRVEHAVPPKKGRRHGMRLLRDLLALRPVGQRTNVAMACEQAQRHLAHRSLVFIISDFNDPGAESALRRLGARHEVVVLTVDDPVEHALPAAGVLVLADPETGERIEIDSSDADFRARYAAAALAAETQRNEMFARTGVTAVSLRTDAPIVEPLLEFFRRSRAMTRRSR